MLKRIEYGLRSAREGTLVAGTLLLAVVEAPETQIFATAVRCFILSRPCKAAEHGESDRQPKFSEPCFESPRGFRTCDTRTSSEHVWTLTTRVWNLSCTVTLVVSGLPIGICGRCTTVQIIALPTM